MKKIKCFFLCLKDRLSFFGNRILAKYRLNRQKRRWSVATDEFDKCFDMDGVSLSYLSKKEQDSFIKELFIAREKIHQKTL